MKLTSHVYTNLSEINEQLHSSAFKFHNTPATTDLRQTGKFYPRFLTEINPQLLPKLL